MQKRLLLTIYFFLTSFVAISQSYSFAGVAKSLNNKVLHGANILAFPKQSSETKFAISNQKGEYRLRLEKGITYSIEVSYLGYEKLVFEYTAEKDETKDLVLTPKTNELDKMILEYKIPIEVKEDTITYNADTIINLWLHLVTNSIAMYSIIIY